MTHYPDCAVCRHTVDPGDDYVRVKVESVRVDDRNEGREYYFHTRCAWSTTEGWAEP